MHIVEAIQGQYYLIRKFNTKLRQKLYQALPDKIILVPTFYTPEDTPSAQQPTPVQDLTPAGRPLRKAARQSFNVSQVVTNRPPPTKKSSIYKASWNPEDQPHDDFHSSITLIRPCGRTNSISSATSNTSSDMLTLNSDHELSWDSSPEQYSLTPSPTIQSIPRSFDAVSS